MVARGLMLRRSIDSYCSESDRDSQPRRDMPYPDDWSDLTLIREILQPLYTATIDLEGCMETFGREGLLHQVIIRLEDLMEDLKDHKTRQQFAGDPNIKLSIQAAIEILAKYLNLTRRSTAWTASVVLNPRFKWRIFDTLWGEKGNNARLLQAQTSVKNMWLTEYKSQPSSQTASQASPPRKIRRTFDYSKFDSLANQDTIQDEYDRYIETKIDLVEDPITWWRNHEGTYPDLSKMAFDHMAIPAMSDEPERTFSKAGYIITSRRSQLGSDVIEAGECLKSWLTKGVVSLGK
jgi:hypothetical protein